MKRFLTSLFTVAAVFAVVAGVLGLANRSDAPAGAAAPAGPARTTAERIERLQALLRAEPRDARGLAALGELYLQRARETFDPGYYRRADAVLRRAVSIEPDSERALTALGMLALARHDFRAGLALGRRAHRAAPAAVAPYAVLVDASVELGRYGAAIRYAQEMVDRRPGLASYARASYLRELRGDLDGAASAMRLAADAGGEVAENVAYVSALLGQLELSRGRLGAAARAHRRALHLLPAYPPAEAGLARVDAARGRLSRAARRYRALLQRVPSIEYAVALGEVELARGRRVAAREAFALVGVQERLLAAGGVNADAELALFEADHGDPAHAVRLGRAAFAQAPSVRSAHALGWALTRAGRPAEGLRYARRALSLGSRDPLFLYHASVAARDAGQRALARRLLARARRHRASLSPLYLRRLR